MNGGAAAGGARWPPTLNAHIDQDVNGEPIRSMGIGWVFQQLPVTMLNLWMPLNDAQVRPLALMDTLTNEPSRGHLAKWSTTTFNITSDRFLATTAASTSGGWYFHSQLNPGDAIVFSTLDTPHTSFGRPEHLRRGGGGVRYSVEMRCIAVLLPGTDIAATAFALLLGLLFCLYAFRSSSNPRIVGTTGPATQK